MLCLPLENGYNTLVRTLTIFWDSPNEWLQYTGQNTNNILDLPPNEWLQYTSQNTNNIVCLPLTNGYNTLDKTLTICWISP